MTGETEIKLYNLEFTPLLTARLAPVPAIRNGTTVRWRAQSCARGLYGLRTRRQPILIHDHIEAAQLMAVLPSASIEFDKRSEEQTSELQSLMRISYAVFCFKK